MVGGAGFVGQGHQRRIKNEGRVTILLITSSIAAAMGGLLFGYDVGISGGVSLMESFLNKFLPSLLEQQKPTVAGEGNVFCKFHNPLLIWFTSSLYLAASIASLLASVVTRNFGRKASMLVGGIACLIGSTINGLAMKVTSLIIGRLLLGVGVGFANQSIPVYLSELAPANFRGAFGIGFQLAVTIGILTAGLVNLGTEKIEGEWGWRVSLALSGIPAIILVACVAMLLPETPNSLIERGYPEKAKLMLQRIRGSPDVSHEFNYLVMASEAARKVEHPWRNILEPRYRPQLVICIVIPIFQQLTGINVIMFYAPVLFRILGFHDDATLMSTLISGFVNMLATIVSIQSVDKYGRRPFFLEGGVQMILSQIAVGMTIALNLGLNGEKHLSKNDANLLLLLVCSYIAAFAWSWGPLGWLIPSEICPLEIRSAGQAISLSINMLFTFLIAHVFLSTLCQIKLGIFFLIFAFVIIMTIFVALFLPETKNIPIEDMNRIWKDHWYWGKYIPDEPFTDEPSSRGRIAF
ncbi:hypothetical protein PTKIN_Ptkin02bG0135000 [Pterospermum kingtungense]